mmetsp:Transcript_14908/g.38094  ORF Transcript_14908/g.38094 Transcript_14908/m.38094 type:complete len:119 (-) Transcript_14908:317-673(-)
MVHLEHDAFLSELSQMYLAKKSAGSVWITFKKAPPLALGVKRTRAGAPLAAADAAGPPPTPAVVVRATDGKKKTIRTLVPRGEHVRFQSEMAAVTRASMSELQKKAKTRGSRKSKAVV